MEGGAARCQKCAQMQDELTRNLREKADDKQEIRKLDKLVSDLTAKLAKAEGKAQQALTVCTSPPAIAPSGSVVEQSRVLERAALAIVLRPHCPVGRHHPRRRAQDAQDAVWFGNDGVLCARARTTAQSASEKDEGLAAKDSKIAELEKNLEVQGAGSRVQKYGC
jgi:hypothetical protein